MMAARDRDGSTGSGAPEIGFTMESRSSGNMGNNQKTGGKHKILEYDLRGERPTAV
jgi:hypothetical protein